MTLDDARAAYRVLAQLQEIAEQSGDDQLVGAVDQVLASMVALLLGTESAA